MEHNNPIPKFDPWTGEPLPPPKERRMSTRRDLVLAVLLALLGALTIDTLVYAQLGLGMAVCLLLLLAVTVWYLWPSRRCVSAYGVFCVCAVTALAVSLIFSDDGTLKTFAVLGSILLSTLALVEGMRQRRFAAGSIASAADLGEMLFVRSFGRIPDGAYALLYTQTADGSPRKRRLGRVLIGLGCALPVVCVVVPLLASSDAAFEGMLRSLSLPEMIGHGFAAATGLFLALVLFSQLFCLPHSEPGTESRTTRPGRLDPVIVVSFLSALGLVYVLYLLSQGAYFFSGFRGLLPEGFSVAAYARRGFFEMCGICVLNLTLVFLAMLFCRQREGKVPLAVRLICLFLCVFSLVLIATALSKMVLYMHSFGLTRLRILTSAFMGLLAVLFVTAILRLFTQRLRYGKVAVVAAAVLVIGLNFANVDGIVASYNVHAYQDGRLDSIDVQTLAGLSDAAVPYLAELLDDADPDVADQAREELRWRALYLFDVEETERGDGPATVTLSRHLDDTLRSFNVVEARARQVIRDKQDRIFE